MDSGQPWNPIEENVGMSTAPALAFAAYIRTSTDDQQSPEDSKRCHVLDGMGRTAADAMDALFGEV
jgi:hypothetical protein